jgi:hypothetical protein
MRVLEPMLPIEQLTAIRNWLPRPAGRDRDTSSRGGPGNLGLIEGNIKMHLKKTAKLFLVLVVILTASPALAEQMARHDGYCRSCEQKAGACRDWTFGTCVGRESDVPRWNGGNKTHDDWSAGMILG